MNTPVVKIPEGQLQGSVRENMDGGKFYAFLGVPYAKPPVGNLRFKVRIWKTMIRTCNGCK